VGRRFIRLCMRTVGADHPHACGEKTRIPISQSLPYGSSPRVWGEVVRVGAGADKSRIIPTRVGRSCEISADFSSAQDHPHACGEKRKNGSRVGCAAGSSPRVWGEARNTNHITKKSRIIPTRVGRSIDSRFHIVYSQDHPHACGEKFCNVHPNPNHTGSSPRVWGEGNLLLSPREIPRIIPTRVGRRLAIPPNASHAQDHPHACGEKSVFTAYTPL